MTANSQQDVEGLRRIGAVVARTVQEMKKKARAGMTTKELDEIGGRYLKSCGAVSAPKAAYGFPGHTCISLNRDIAHGIPGSVKIRPGDLINIDVSAEMDGYYADTGHSFQLPPHTPALTRLCRYTYTTMMKVISQLRADVRVNEIGRLIQAEAQRGGYRVIRNLCSHGVGKALHEEPKEILPFYSKDDKRVLHEGLVITVEPFLSTGASYAVQQPDGWTMRLPDRSFAAQHEHTIIITKGRPIVVTRL
ncbi:methionine aminopeptidase [Gordoniibacillus kamchatkensis]|uniref:Methionine aminopeptidase n=1 Tax=Gordoniibacillus kamchatkensis TaxID=1590651 RepID=A0ABR5AN83_9BACL|nr:type I methionyl aminopeptidase [Paenibacillus sp. VKM B-2647]KIL42273.1 methionine aminopeptidase [Paenibacillus sp. VKM B-2647]